jgi:hypothetical protein
MESSSATQTDRRPLMRELCTPAAVFCPIVRPHLPTSGTQAPRTWDSSLGTETLYVRLEGQKLHDPAQATAPPNLLDPIPADLFMPVHPASSPCRRNSSISAYVCMYRAVTPSCSGRLARLGRGPLHPGDRQQSQLLTKRLRHCRGEGIRNPPVWHDCGHLLT